MKPQILIKPNRTDVYLYYTCPKCSAEHQVFYPEVKYPGGLRCYCGANLKFFPITAAKLSLTYAGQDSKLSSFPHLNLKSPLTNPDLMVNCVDALMALGFNKTKATEQTNRVIKIFPNGPVEDCIKEVFRK